MSSAVETVFGIPELLDQILKDVGASDIFIFQRINKTFRQTICRTSHTWPRRLMRFHNPYMEPDSDGEVLADCNKLFASPRFLCFLYLEPSKLERCTILGHPEKYPTLHLRYSYLPRSAISRRIWPLERVYPHEVGIKMRRWEKAYEVTPSWAHVWLPHTTIRISLKVYRHEHKHQYTETMQLDKDKAEMCSVAMALDTLVARSERRGVRERSWESGRFE
jgi:hypothetical protein